MTSPSRITLIAAEPFSLDQASAWVIASASVVTWASGRFSPSASKV
jgi:hypothetical protein